METAVVAEVQDQPTTKEDKPSDRQMRERRFSQKLEKKKPHIEKLARPSSLQELPKEEFSVDPRVQRQLNEERVVAMAADFRPDSMGLVTASRRADGQTYVLDGAHRIAAARRAQYTGLIATRLFTELTIAEEAGLFLTLNNSKPVQPIDRFRVRVTLGDRVAININSVLKAYGLHVSWSTTSQADSVSAIVTLEKVYRGAGVREDGEYTDLIDKVVSTIHGAYGSGNTGSTYSRCLIEGLGIMWAHFGSRIEKARLIEALSAIPPRQFVARARTRRDVNGGPLGENAAEVLHAAYNHRKRDKLPEFAQVDPRNNHVPNYTQDPLYVDPAQYVKDQRDAEKVNA